MVEFISKGHGEHSFIVKSKSGGLLLRSIDFTDRNEINQTLLELHKSDQINLERKTNYEGSFQFHLKNGHGKVIGSSESYSFEAGMENGIKELTKSILNPKLT